MAFQGNALSTATLPSEVAGSIGNVLALTDNRDLNQLICEKWSEVVDKDKLYRWSSQSPQVEQQIAGMGIPIWFHLTKPSQLSYDLKSNKILLHWHNNTNGTLKKSAGTILISENQGKISFDRHVDSAETRMLVLERVAPDLMGLLHRQHVLFIQCDSYQEALLAVLNKVQRLYPELPHEHISSVLLEREGEFPTTLAHGVAAPHLHCSVLTEPICFVARIPDGIELHTYEGELVQLLFLLLSPESEPELHFRLLAEIAKIASNPELVQRLETARTADEFIQYFKEKKS